MFDRFIINSNDFDGPVLVTGAGGCIGSWVVALLLKANISVVAFDISKNKKRLKLLIDNEKLDKLTWVVGDIANTESVAKVITNNGICSIIHLAALQVPFCIDDPIAGAKVNVIGTLNILEAARQNNLKRITYASSIASHALTPNSNYLGTLYGAYKLCDENLASVYYQDWGVPSIGIRPGIIYGIGRDQGMTSKITIATLATAANKPFTIPFSGPISALHAGEAAAAFIKVVSKERVESRIFDMNGASTTVENWVKILKKIEPKANIRIDGGILPFPFDLPDAPLRTYLGDYGMVDLGEGIKQTYETFKNLLSQNKISIANL
jgi:nucleoside-diphosphate-sugar epimerase|tara:strand:+ start:753 stop:1721 length:969 start_codon:yes stop_codon:yes gene_type:complete